MRLLRRVRALFILSREQPEEAHALRLWVRGYALTKAEAREGFRGHFAVLRVRPLEDGLWSVPAQKDPVLLERHPQRKRPRRDHPDWGHPVLRRVRKGEVFACRHEAQALLDQLRDEFPKVTIAREPGLHIIVYQQAEHALPVRKHVLEIVPHGAGHIIAHRA